MKWEVKIRGRERGRGYVCVCVFFFKKKNLQFRSCYELTVLVAQINSAAKHTSKSNVLAKHNLEGEKKRRKKERKREREREREREMR